MIYIQSEELENRSVEEKVHTVHKTMITVQLKLRNGLRKSSTLLSLLNHSPMLHTLR